jgi:hypothetical protein
MVPISYRKWSGHYNGANRKTGKLSKRKKGNGLDNIFLHKNLKRMYGEITEPLSKRPNYSFVGNLLIIDYYQSNIQLTLISK